MRVLNSTTAKFLVNYQQRNQISSFFYGCGSPPIFHGQTAIMKGVEGMQVLMKDRELKKNVLNCFVVVALMYPLLGST